MNDKQISVINKLIIYVLYAIIIMSCIIISKQIHDMFVLPKEVVFQALVLFAVVLLFMKALLGGEVTLRKSGLNVVILLFYLLNVLSLTWSTNYYLSYRAIARLTFYIVLYFIIIGSMNEGNVKKAVKLFVFVAVIEAIYGFIQYFQLDPFMALNMGDRRNIIGTLGYHNYLAVYLMMITPLIICEIHNSVNIVKKYLYTIVLAITIACIFIIQSRSALVALAVSVGSYYIMMSRRREKKVFQGKKRILFLIFAIVLIVLGVAFISPGQAVRTKLKAYYSKRQNTIQSRKIIWKTAIKMIERKPIYGWGVDTFKYHYLDWLYDAEKDLEPADYILEEAENVHNEFMQTWVETGLPGMILFILIIIFYLKETFLIQHDRGNNYMASLSVAFTASIIGIMVDSLVNFPFHIVPINIAIWFIFGLGIVAKKDCLVISGKKLTLVLVSIVVVLLVLFKGTMNSFMASKYLLKGMRYSQLGDYSSGEDNYMKAINYNPGNGTIHFVYGSMLLNVGRREEGIKELKKAERSLKDVFLYRNLGRAYMEEKDFDKAEYYYEKNMKTGIHFLESLTNMGNMYFVKGEIDRAIEYYLKALYWNNDHLEANENIALAYLKIGMKEEAKRRFSRAIEFGSRKAVVFNNLGGIFFGLGDKEKAVSLWKKTLEMYPGNRIAIYNLEVAERKKKSNNGG